MWTKARLPLPQKTTKIYTTLAFPKPQCPVSKDALAVQASQLPGLLRSLSCPGLQRCPSCQGYCASSPVRAGIPKCPGRAMPTRLTPHQDAPLRQGIIMPVRAKLVPCPPWVAPMTKRCPGPLVPCSPLCQGWSCPASCAQWPSPSFPSSRQPEKVAPGNCIPWRGRRVGTSPRLGRPAPPLSPA